MTENEQFIRPADRFEVTPLGLLAEKMEADGLAFEPDIVAMRALLRRLDIPHSGGVRAALFFEGDQTSDVTDFVHPAAQSLLQPFDMKVPVNELESNAITQSISAELATKRSLDASEQAYEANHNLALWFGSGVVTLGGTLVTLSQLPSGRLVEGLTVVGAAITVGAAATALVLRNRGRRIVQSSSLIRVPDVTDIDPPIRVVSIRG